MRVHPRFALALACCAGAAAAEPMADIKACAAIVEASSRLACYDALAGRPSAAALPAPSAPASPVAAISAPPAPAVPAAPVAASSPPPAPAMPAAVTAPAPPPPAQEFGIDSMPRQVQRAKDSRDQELHARLAGEFRGWEDGTLFELDNGQVWKAAGGDRAYYKAVPPGQAVHIERRWSGTYWMRVDGFRRAIVVKRVR